MTRMPTDVVGAATATVAGSVLVVAGWIASRRFGIPAAQDRLIATLQETVQIQTTQIAALKAENEQLKGRVTHLEQVMRDAEILKERRRAARA